MSNYIILFLILKVVPARKVYEFEFHASQAMAPEATIIVTYTRETKEIVGDSFKFKVDGVFQNSVCITYLIKNIFTLCS